MNSLARRVLLATGLGLFLQGAAAQPAPPPAAPDEFRVTLLGTGSPAPVMRRLVRACWSKPAARSC